jgi:fatty-acyl-CoA synthase
VHVRDGQGRLVRCKAGEAGELLAAVDASGKNPARRFDGASGKPSLQGQRGRQPGCAGHYAESSTIVGYADANATARKLVRDVRSKGDAYFRSGDVVVQSWHGAIYFVDRLGETFRWKGENVSTCELAAHVVSAASTLGVRECVAYGARVPRPSGRCGMVAVVLAPEVGAGSPSADWLQQLYEALVGSADIAPYAVPRCVLLDDGGDA